VGHKVAAQLLSGSAIKQNDRKINYKSNYSAAQLLGGTLSSTLQRY